MAQYDGLLQQISDYEQLSIERKNRLRELRDSVSTAHEKLKTTEECIVNLQNELKLKTNELIDNELTSKLLTSRESIFNQRKAKLEKNVNDLDSDKLAVSKSLFEEREHFCETIHQLNAKCGLNNLYCKTREQEFNNEISVLEEQKKSLQSDLAEMKEKLNVINSMNAEKVDLNQQLETINRTIREMASSWCTEVQKSNDLEKEYESVTNITTSNPDFIRIQQELSEERKTSYKLEEEHNNLQAKFHTLYQKIWRQKQQRYK